ncbi:MAG: site-specific integrase [Sphingobacteriales bacterium]|nr:site-specific integrase [Sphingobacteriales bacterium]
MVVRMPCIGVVLNWRGEPRKSGLYPVHIRIKIGNTARYFNVPLPQKIRKEQWQGKDGNWIKNTHPFAFEINNKIIELKGQINEYIKRTLNFNKPLTVENIIAHLTNKGENKSFLEFMDRYIKRPPEKLEPNTIKKYATTLTHLKKFKREIFFTEIDNTLLRDFSRFMQTDLELGGAATKKYLEAFKKVIRHARRENYISPQQMEFLFDGVKVRVEKAKRTFLDLNEVKRWKAVHFEPDYQYLERDRDLFLFQVYTGYYYKDLLIFTKDHLQMDEEYGHIILGARDKNGNQTIIPLFKFPYAQTILEKYRSRAGDKLVFDKRFLIEEPVYNRHLKEIAKLAGIHKNITNKVARHTNAQLWIRYGAEGAVLSKMMGHTKQETTRNYYDVNLPEIVEGTKRVDFGAMGI